MRFLLVLFLACGGGDFAPSGYVSAADAGSTCSPDWCHYNGARCIGDAGVLCRCVQRCQPEWCDRFDLFDVVCE